MCLQALDALWQKGDLKGIRWQSIVAAWVAALVHDIGHLAFSHGLDELTELGLATHEARSRELVMESEVAEILRTDYHLDPKRVADMIEVPDHYYCPDDELLAALICGGRKKFPFDVDRGDYILRDRRECGLPPVTNIYGILNGLRIVQVGKNRTLVLTKEAALFTKELLQARQNSFLMLYNNNLEERAAKAMLIRASQETLLDRELVPSNFATKDELLLARLQHSRHPMVKDLVVALEDRRLYKNALQLCPRDELFQPLAAFYGKPMARRALEDAISERIRKDFERRGKKCLATTDRVLISPPRPPKRLDLQGTYVLSGHPSDSHSRVMPFEEITGPVSESMYRQDIAGQLALLFLPPEAEVPERLLLRALHEALSAIRPNH
jgi:HD superfamily phosphohydrolase